MNANELADLLETGGEKTLDNAATMLRQQKNEIEDLKSANRFIQNFAEEQHQRAVALENELDRAVELYTDKAIENEALEKELTEAGGMIGVLREQLQEEIQARADALDDLNNRMMKFMKSYNEMAWKLEEVGGAYTHPVKEQDTDCQYCKQGCIRCDARKQLTDAEIRTIQDMCHLKNVGYNNFIMRFARAILRKAQEK
jgi:DNA repair exonuclease SbcCD ATPase subunit